MKTFKTMLKTELKLSLRGMDMFIFAICVPLAVLVILGILYGGKPACEGAGYTFLEQSFGALSTISICAGGVMGLPLVVSDYRSKGILKRYKVTPVRPAMILFVQVAVYTLYAVLSLMLLYVAAGKPAGNIQRRLFSLSHHSQNRKTKTKKLRRKQHSYLILRKNAWRGRRKVLEALCG